MEMANSTILSALSPRVLALDDDKGSLISIETELKPKGFRVDLCQDYDEAITLLEAHSYDALVVDLNLKSKKTGIDFIDFALDKQPGIPIVVVSAYVGERWGDNLSNLWMKRMTFMSMQLSKPGFESRLGEWADNYLLFRSNKASAQSETYHSEDIRVNRLVSEIIPIVATTSSLPVLILGESGTGKEDFARLIHESPQNPYRSGPFIAVNCAAISDTLILSELFGHVKNSFTGAEDHRLGWFLEASGWKHEPLSARKSRQVIVDEILKHFGLSDINDFYQKVISGGDFKTQKRVIDGFMTEINDLVRKLGVLDDYNSWLSKNGNDVGNVKKAMNKVDTVVRLMNTSYERTSEDSAEYLFVDNAKPGTLFLDEIGDLSPAAEVALLRALDGYGIRPLGYTGPALLPDCRIIAATNRIRSRADVRETFESGEKCGTMRKDLFYRLEGWIVQLPALRERKTATGEFEWGISLKKWAAGDGLIFEEDGFNDFIKECAIKSGRLWDGNWRELSHVYARAKAVAGMRPGNRTITKSDLMFASQWVIAEGDEETSGRARGKEEVNNTTGQKLNDATHSDGRVKEMFPSEELRANARKFLDRYEDACQKMIGKNHITQRDIGNVISVTHNTIIGNCKKYAAVMLAFLDEFPDVWPKLLQKTKIRSWCERHLGA
jgi:DNA-binding NtrC family response regulator